MSSCSSMSHTGELAGRSGLLYRRADAAGGFNAITMSLKLLSASSSSDILRVVKSVMLDMLCVVAAAYDINAGELQPMEFLNLLGFMRLLMDGEEGPGSRHP